MQYAIAFLEGMVTFISPCLLPMLPVYLSYFAGGGERGTGRTVKNSLGFVAGFSAVFVAMGALAGSLGGLLARYRTGLNLVTGLVVVLFGLGMLGILPLGIFKGSGRAVRGEMGFFSSALFGVVFSVGWTPCVGAFLGSALMLASSRGHAMEGVVMLLCYSLGLGIPFLMSALLMDRLRAAFGFIKNNYRVINAVCGWLLVLLGVAMATGLLGRLSGLAV